MPDYGNNFRLAADHEVVANHREKGAKIYTFSLMAIEFSRTDFAEAFMNDERERMKLMGDRHEAQNRLATRH